MGKVFNELGPDSRNDFPPVHCLGQFFRPVNLERGEVHSVEYLRQVGQTVLPEDSNPFNAIR